MQITAKNQTDNAPVTSLKKAGKPLYLAVLACLLLPIASLAQQQSPTLDFSWAQDPPNLNALVDFTETESNFRVVVTRFMEDRGGLQRRYPVLYSPVRQTRLQKFYEDWQQSLAKVDFGKLNHEGQIDYILLRNRLTYFLEGLRLENERWKKIADLVPFSDRLRMLPEDRFDRKRLDPRATAATLDEVRDQLIALNDALIAEARTSDGVIQRSDLTPGEASRATAYLTHLKEVLEHWNQFYNGYDPLYSWWCRTPFEKLIQALDDYSKSITLHLVGIEPGERGGPVIGDPVMEAGLQADLAVEMIPYNARELIAVGEREFKWIEERFKEVSNKMGFGDDWHAALEHTKNLAPDPGEKPWVIFDIADYSREFIADKLDAVSWPSLAEEIWRLQMSTPERQLVMPFFGGGEVTSVSYPTDGMEYKDRLMSMRGNTPHFNFPTVMHELIPGHHLQGFMRNRFNTSRSRLAGTPFWHEGNSLYWELLLWDEDFARNDPDRIGTLFWRMHRAARIIFSMKFQLGEWTPQQCIDFLVDRVGHERANAEAEVRRTATAAPLYQIAYMIGGLQLRALYKEAVESGKITAKQFHDQLLIGGSMPIEMVRARILGLPLSKDYKSIWRWEGNIL